MNKKGFTLIELLAVIIILGILMIIAIPSVTKYINDSRKSSYIDTARELIGGARNLVNDGKLEMYDTDATYYIDIACLKTENGGKAVSPYGDFVKDKAFVVVTFDGKGYEYFWTSIDDSGQGIKELVRYDKLDTDKIESDLKTDDIKIDRGLDGRSKVILIREANNCQKEGSIPAGSQVDSATGDENSPIIYPEGKTKATVEVGDIVTIGTEEFYVVKHDGSDLVLLAHYNLNVGSNKKESATEGIQDSEVKGWVSIGTKYGNVAFSSTNYWNGKVGSDYPGSYCSSNTYTTGTNCAYVYDSNSNLKTYVDAYKTYLEGQGATIKEARLLRVEEAYELECGNGAWNCNNAPSFVKETSYWLGSAFDIYSVWNVRSNGYFGDSSYDTSYYCGVRPVIVI